MYYRFHSFYTKLNLVRFSINIFLAASNVSQSEDISFYASAHPFRRSDAVFSPLRFLVEGVASVSAIRTPFPGGVPGGVSNITTSTMSRIIINEYAY